MLLAMLVAFIRSGKGRENKGMQQWLRSWEVSISPQLAHVDDHVC
jgi:hypothetical protein